MICDNCRMHLPNDSVYCQYCGEKTLQEDSQKCIHEKCNNLNCNPQNTTEVIDQSSKKLQEKTHRNNRKPLSNTRWLTKRWIPYVICCSIIMLVLAGINVYQYLLHQKCIAKENENVAIIAELKNQNTTLNDEITQKDDRLSSDKSEIIKLKNEISSLEDTAELYREIVNVVKYRNLGYAAENFNTYESIVVVNKHEQNKKITLTAYWTNGGTVSVNYDTYYPATSVSFDQHNWTTSTKMTVQPNYSGITVVTFSNDVNNQTFDVIIIVE